MACARMIRGADSIYSIDISPDGEMFAVGCVESGILLLRTCSNNVRPEAGEEGFYHNNKNNAISTASFSPKLFATGSDAGFLQVWDYSNHACVATLRRPYSERPEAVAFSPDGHLLAAGFYGKGILLWRTNDWTVSSAVMADITQPSNLAFSHDNRLLASCCAGRLRLWHVCDSTDGSAAHTIDGPVLELEELLYWAKFSPVDNQLLACCGTDGFLALARVSASNNAIDVEHELRGHLDVVHSVAFSPCGKQLASTSRDRTMRLWSVASGICKQQLQHPYNVYGAVFFPNGKQLASACWDGNIRVWTLCPWNDRVHHLFGAQLKMAIFTLMCARAKLEHEQGLRRSARRVMPLPRLPMEVWLLVCEQLALAQAHAYYT